jgi:hypothetical protein
MLKPPPRSSTLALLSVAFLVIPGCATLPRAPHASTTPADTVADTFWAGREKTVYFARGGMHHVTGNWEVHFRPDGTLRVWSSVEGPGVLDGHWQQRGSEVTLRMGSAAYTGIISFDYIVGTSRGVFAENHSWYLVRATRPPSHFRHKTSNHAMERTADRRAISFLR